jgi:hypothetical protein
VAAIVIDIDETLVDTLRRRFEAWRIVLGREIPLASVEEHESRDILKIYAGSDEEVWQRFWRILLCWEEIGVDLLKFDTALPYAADVVRRWSVDYRIAYFTGRSTNMHDLTLKELGQLGLPLDDVDLVMLSLEDWNLYFQSKASSVQLRSSLFSSVNSRYKIARVVDDFPSFFSIYKKFEVPKRIGIQRSRIYSRQEYISQGATQVVDKWQDLLC